MEIAAAMLPCIATAQTVAYYQFDGAVGSPVTTVFDSGPSSLHGTNVGSSAYSAGVIGTGFDVSGDLNYASIPHSAGFVLTNHWTVELFLKAHQPYTTYGSDPSKVINKLYTGSAGGATESFSIQFFADGHIGGTIGFSVGSGQDVNTSGTETFADGEWHHVALVYDSNSKGTTNILSLYVDYTLRATKSGSFPPIPWGNFPIYIGAGNFPGGQDNGEFRRNFDGKIDEVRISNEALQPSQFVTIPSGQFALVTISNALVGAQLRWDSQTNHAYQVQYVPQIPANSWSNLGGPLTGNGNWLTSTDAFVPNRTQRFFRVLESP